MNIHSNSTVFYLSNVRDGIRELSETAACGHLFPVPEHGIRGEGLSDSRVHDLRQVLSRPGECRL